MSPVAPAVAPTLPPRPTPPGGNRWLWTFALVSLVELVGVAADSALLQWLAKPLLAPILAGHLLSRTRRYPRVLLGLVFATAGDVALLVDGRTAFLVGMGCFLLTQATLVTAFLRAARPRLLTVGAYGLLWAAGNLLLWQRLGPLRLPILAYSLALTAMAATATAVNRWTAVGGALFLLSDLLIGVSVAGTRLPAHELLVMVTYLLALLLIVTGWVRHLDRTPRQP